MDFDLKHSAHFDLKHSAGFCACHRDKRTCFCLPFVSVIYITLNNFRILLLYWILLFDLDIYLTFTFILDLREEFTSVKCPPSPVVSSPSESDDDSTQFPLSQVSPSIMLTHTPASSQNKNVSASGQVHKAVDKPNPCKAPSRKVLIAGDSLLNRMYISKMKVSDIPSVKLTKRGDNLSGTISRFINYASKNSSETLDVVLLAGTNDLSVRSVSPEKLINTLDSSLKELKQFNNVHHVFLCKIPPRFDFHNVNIKVNQYNNILSERFSDSEHISVIDTIPPEFRFYYIDGLHFSNLGLNKVCRNILSHLYEVLAPSSYKKRKGASKNRS